MTSPALAGRSDAAHVEDSLCDLNQVVSRLERSILDIAGRQITVQIALAAGVLRVAGREAEVAQILLSLTGEARRLLAPGGRLMIETRGLNDGHLSRADSIKEDRASLVVRIEHGGGPPPTKSAPSELGVSAIEGLLERLGGRLELVPVAKDGVAYVAYLRYAAPALSSGRMPIAVPHGASVVLLIEDEPQVQAVTARILRAFGYSVLTAHNERTALAHAEQHGAAIGLVISDLVLPGVSGTDLVERLHTPCGHARVLYVSGYSPDHIGPLAAGVRFLRKPFSAEELVTSVRELLAAEPC